jgi:hypothetical protein
VQILISRFGGPGPILFAGVSNGSVRLSTRYVGVVASLTLSAFDGYLTDGRWRMSYEGWSRTPLTEQIGRSRFINSLFQEHEEYYILYRAQRSSTINLKYCWILKESKTVRLHLLLSPYQFEDILHNIDSGIGRLRLRT